MFSERKEVSFELIVVLMHCVTFDEIYIIGIKDCMEHFRLVTCFPRVCRGGEDFYLDLLALAGIS